MADAARPAARLTVLTGPSGVGKDRVIEFVRARSPLLWLSVAATTRPPGRHEIDGVHYFFVDRSEFDQLVASGKLLEWTEVAGHRYGTPEEPVRQRLRAGRPVLMKIDPRGARQVRAAVPDARLVLLLAPGDIGRWPDERDFDATIVNESAERSAEELVGLLGSSFLTPARPRTSG